MTKGWCARERPGLNDWLLVFVTLNDRLWGHPNDALATSMVDSRRAAQNSEWPLLSRRRSTPTGPLSTRPLCSLFRAIFLPAKQAIWENTMGYSEHDPAARERRTWNAGRIVGAKWALKPQQVWAIRFWLDHERRLRDRALFDLAIDSKLRGVDVVKVRIGDLVRGGSVRARSIVVQQKTVRPVQFELLEAAWSVILASTSKTLSICQKTPRCRS